MLPIGDDSWRRAGGGPLSRHGLAIASLTCCSLLVLAFASQLLLEPGSVALPSGLAFVPGSLFGGTSLPVTGVPPPATLVTYQFLHAGWLHLLSNLLFLWVFGPKVEHTLSPGRWTVLFLASGVAAALAQAGPDPSSTVPLIGASGGVAGILGSYLVLHPRAEIRVLVPVVIVLRVVQLPAWVVLAAWFLVQVLYTNWSGGEVAGVAFRAHVGGFVCGLVLGPVLHFLALLSADARPVARTLRSRDSSH